MFLFIVCFVISAANAAISANTVWEVRSSATSANANGCGFVTGASGTDYSQQDAAQYNLTGATSAGANAIILHASAASDMVGNLAHVISGTNATPGWYEIISVVAGVSITVDRNWGTGAVSSGVVNIGGACSFGSSTSNQTDANLLAAQVAGNTMWIKSGSYTMGTGSYTSPDCTNAAPCTLAGYKTTRGDTTTGSNRPALTLGGTQWNSGAYRLVQNLDFNGSNTIMMTGNGSNVYYNIKAVNNSTTTNRYALVPVAHDFVVGSEFVSQNGYAVGISNNNVVVKGSYIHDSQMGVRLTATAGIVTLTHNIFAGNFSKQFTTAAANTGAIIIDGNTFYGAEGKLGTGVDLASGTSNVKLLNNIFYGLTTAVTAAAAVNNWANWNDFYNNTTNRTNWAAGGSDITSAPGFKSVTTIAGTAGSLSGSVLTDATKDFSNVVNNQDFLYISGGTGATTGIYLVTSHTSTTLTLATAPGGSGSDIAYTIRTGHDFAVGPSMKFKGFPGTFPAQLTTGYLDLGAAQRHEYGRPVR